MTLKVPLVVRLKTPRADTHITRQVQSLRLRDSAPGGFATASFELSRPLDVDSDELQQFGRVYVYDGRTGEEVWSGFQDNPGRSAGSDGQVWSVSAVGVSSRAQDRTGPYCYIDRTYDRWLRADNQTPGAQVDIGENPGLSVGVGLPAMTFRFPQGLNVVTGSRAVMRYVLLADTGQHLARVDYQWDAAVSTGTEQMQLATRTAGFTATVERAEALATSGSGFAPKSVGTHWTTPQQYADLRLLRVSGGGVVGDDLNWVGVTGLYVMGTRVDATGTELVDAASYQPTAAGAVLASQVVEDVVGRFLNPWVDGAGAAITTTSYLIDQLAFPDGATGADILDQVMVLEPAYTWTIRESSDLLAGTGARFTWAPWPTTVRYEASTADGFQDRASGSELFNAVQVRWKDVNGTVRTWRQTQAVPVLDDIGLVREGFLDLGDAVGSLANAQQAATQFLADHQYIPNAGTLTVARPVLDLVAGRMVPPYLVRSGELIRVRGVTPRVDSLNPDGRDGSTVFRIAAVDYDADEASSSLELDTYPRSVVQGLARLHKSLARLR